MIKSVPQKVIGSRNDGRANVRYVLNSTEVLRFHPIVDGKMFRVILADKFVGGAVAIPVEDSDQNGHGDPTKYIWLDYSEIFDLVEIGAQHRLSG